MSGIIKPNPLMVDGEYVMDTAELLEIAENIKRVAGEYMIDMANDYVAKGMGKIVKAIKLLEVFAAAAAERGLPFDWVDCAVRPPCNDFPDGVNAAAIDKEGVISLEADWWIQRHPELFAYWYPLPPMPEGVGAKDET